MNPASGHFAEIARNRFHVSIYVYTIVAGWYAPYVTASGANVQPPLSSFPSRSFVLPHFSFAVVITKRELDAGETNKQKRTTPIHSVAHVPM